MTLEVILPQFSDRNSDTLILASGPETVQCEKVSSCFLPSALIFKSDWCWLLHRSKVRVLFRSSACEYLAFPAPLTEAPICPLSAVCSWHCWCSADRKRVDSFLSSLFWSTGLYVCFVPAPTVLIGFCRFFCRRFWDQNPPYREEKKIRRLWEIS